MTSLISHLPVPSLRAPFASSNVGGSSCSLGFRFSSHRRGEFPGLRSEPVGLCSRVSGSQGMGSVGVRAAAVASSGQETRFPFLSGSARKLLTEVAETVDKELGPHLQESQTPADVRYFKSAQGNAEGSVVLRAGKDSKVDFTLESWLHATLPFGTLDIGTMVIMLGTETDSPHFLFEFILSGPVLVVVLDNLPRKDLVLDSDYLKRFYEETDLDKVRETFEKAAGAKPYISPTLFVRTVLSPTAVISRITGTAEVEEGSLDKQISTVVHPGAVQALHLWLDSFRTRGLPVQNMDEMLKRDNQIKEKGVEVDLSANLPRLFGQEITDRIVAAFRAAQ